MPASMRSAMRAHLDIARPITPFRLMEALNARLRPDPVAVLACEAVPDDWHARFSCLGAALRIPHRHPPRAADLERGLAWRVPHAARRDGDGDGAAQVLVGRHDFTTFRSAHCQADSPVRTLDRLDVRADGERISVFASARSFLHHQVRSMVGCLALVGQGKWSADDLAAALAARDRAALGLNAPPDGLYFLRADYPLTAEPRGELDMGRPAELADRLDPVEPIAAFAQESPHRAQRCWDCTNIGDDRRPCTRPVRRLLARAGARRIEHDRVEAVELRRRSAGGGTGRDDRRRPAARACAAALFSDSDASRAASAA